MPAKKSTVINYNELLTDYIDRGQMAAARMERRVDFLWKTVDQGELQFYYDMAKQNWYKEKLVYLGHGFYLNDGFLCLRIKIERPRLCSDDGTNLPIRTYNVYKNFIFRSDTLYVEKLSDRYRKLASYDIKHEMMILEHYYQYHKEIFNRYLVWLDKYNNQNLSGEPFMFDGETDDNYQEYFGGQRCIHT